MKTRSRMSLGNKVGKPGKALGEMLALLAQLTMPEPPKTPVRVVSPRWEAPRTRAQRQ
ncbi:MAG: hypothetical protein ABR524_08485 [Thermoanaerobaculia bacterium]